MKKNFIRLFWLSLLISISYQFTSIAPVDASNLNSSNNNNSTETQQLPPHIYKAEFLTVVGLTALAVIGGTGKSIKNDK